MKQIMFVAVLVIFVIGLTQFTIAEEKKEPVNTISTMSISMPESWYTTVTSDTETLYDVESATYDGTEFIITLKVNEIAINKASGTELDKIKNTLKVKMRDNGRNQLLSTKDVYNDYNKTTMRKNYTISMPANYLKLDGNMTTRREVTLKLGENSIYIVATLGTDLKVVQTGLDNTTNYVAGIDVSKGILVSSADSTNYDLTTGVVLYLPFDHGNYTGTWGTEAIDLSGDNNHGTLTNMNIGLDNASSGWTSTGNQSYGMDFDGTDDNINCGNDASLNIDNSTSGLTISIWIYPESYGDSSYGRIINKRTGDTGYSLMMYNPSSEQTIAYASDATLVNADSTIITLNTWQHIASVFNNTHISFYVDGSNKGSSALTTLTKTSENLYIGDVGDDSRNFNGTIDEVRIYNRALSADEISAQYTLGLATHSSNTNVDYISSSAVTYDTVKQNNMSLTVEIPEVDMDITFNPTNIIFDSYRSDDKDGGNEGLVASYLMDYPTGSVAFDSSGNGNDGTITNAQWSTDTHNDTGSSLYFDGNNDWVAISNSDSMNFTEAFTIEAWINKRQEHTRYAIYYDWLFTPAQERIFFEIGTDNFISGGTANPSSVQDSFKGDTNVTIGWHYVNFLYNGTHMYSYIDAVLDDVETTTTASLYPSEVTSYIGVSSTFTLDFNGTIDSVRIYDRALSATEIADHYTNDLPKYQNVTFNTTDARYFQEETVTITNEYLNEDNLTKVRVSFPYALNQYDLFSVNLTEYLGWNPDEIINVWYDSYTGNTDNSTLKDTNDWNTWVDTCESGNTTGLVGCWNFNELDGTIAKDRANNSANNNDGTLTNMNLGVDNSSSGWTRDGKYGNALDFDGTDDFVTRANTVLPNTNVGESHTISAWIYPNVVNSGGSIQYIVQGFKSGVEALSIGYRTDGRMCLQYYFGGGSSCVSKGFSDDVMNTANKWYHVSATWTVNINDSLTWYIDSVNRSTGSFTDFDWNVANLNRDISAGTFHIGSSDLTYFNGTIDEVKIYNRALSASEISDEYNLKKDYFDSMPKEESGLIASENWDLYVSNGSISSCIVPSVNFDWTIIDECEKDNENIELGTGSLIIDADLGGKLILRNSANIYSNDLQLLGSGEHINIFSGDIIT